MPDNPLSPPDLPAVEMPCISLSQQDLQSKWPYAYCSKGTATPSAQSFEKYTLRIARGQIMGCLKYVFAHIFCQILEFTE